MKIDFGMIEYKISFHLNEKTLYECKFTDYVKAIKKLVEDLKDE